MIRSSKHRQGYQLSVTLADDVTDRFPELSPVGLEPVVLVVELGDARRLNVGQLARDLGWRRPIQTIVTHTSRTGQHVRLLGLETLRKLLAMSEEDRLHQRIVALAR